MKYSSEHNFQINTFQLYFIGIEMKREDILECEWNRIETKTLFRNYLIYQICKRNTVLSLLKKKKHLYSFMYSNAVRLLGKMMKDFQNKFVIFLYSTLPHNRFRLFFWKHFDANNNS